MDGNGEPLVDPSMVMEITPSMVMENLAITYVISSFTRLSDIGRLEEAMG